MFKDIIEATMNDSTTQDYQISDDGTCSTCHETALDADFVQCGICKMEFHAICGACPAEEKWGTKTMIHMFKATSTKRNFTFICNCCLTARETNSADFDGRRIRKMEQNMEEINKELREIKKLVAPTGTSQAQSKPQPSNQHRNSVWFDSEKLATIKAKPVESVLVVNKDDDIEVEKTNTKMVETVVIDSKIQVKKSFKDKGGNLVVVCDSTESRDALKNQVSALNNNIEMKTPKEKRPVISIVGLSKNYENEEVVDMLTQQNNFLKHFSAGNNIRDHINVFAVKPLRGKPDVFQAFARISQVLREGFRTFNDKVTMGLSTCKIYDQFHIKRCNNCQGFGHYFRNCPTPQDNVCAKCGSNHPTRECSSDNRKCVNCVKGKLPEGECKHSADDQTCPTLRKAQVDMKKHLNMHM